MSTDPTDVDLIARVLYNLDRAPGVDHWADIRSTPASDAIDASVAKIQAQGVLAVLGSRLLPPGGQERTEWGRLTLGGQYAVYIAGLQKHHTHYRTVTTFPDGREWPGPWKPIEEET